MNPTVLNAVLCEKILLGRETVLKGAGLKWAYPPNSIGVWIEVANPSEQPFTVSVQIFRGRDFIDESETELVLAGKDYYQPTLTIRGTGAFERKTYKFVVLVNDIPARIMVADFGHPEES